MASAPMERKLILRRVSQAQQWAMLTRDPDFVQQVADSMADTARALRKWLHKNTGGVYPRPPEK